MRRDRMFQPLASCSTGSVRCCSGNRDRGRKTARDRGRPGRKSCSRPRTADGRQAGIGGARHRRCASRAPSPCVVSVARAFADGGPCRTHRRLKPAAARQRNSLPAYLGSAPAAAWPGDASGASYRYAHWRVGYRLHDAPGVAETGAIGSGWSVLPDDGDPLLRRSRSRSSTTAALPLRRGLSARDRQGRHLRHRARRQRRRRKPAPVLEEPHHLSYPQVFARDGEIWMLPEGSGSGKLTLYRASAFPDRWIAATDADDGEISDATLLEHDGPLLAVRHRPRRLRQHLRHAGGLSAPALTGPWTPHRQTRS